MKSTITFSGLLLFSVFWTGACKAQSKASKEIYTQNQKELSDTDYRSKFHFTPKKHWMNDPNGMFYLNGTYHLFFQHYPEGNVWGPMHWGHATTKDFLHWKEHPIALAPDSLGYIFSGSAVVDVNNTSGLGTKDNPAVVAMFTYHDPIKEREGRNNFQTQGIAYSLDAGKTWSKYAHNPVLDNPGIKDFRDPKLQWDEQHQQWIMVLAVKDRVYFYTSTDLLDWKKTSEFGAGIGAHDGVWECPDFFPLEVEGTAQTKWVLLQSLNPGGYNGGSGTQYFVGDFDGDQFTPVKTMQNLPAKHPYWLDFGRDNYAGVSWSNVPKNDGRRIYVGWMSNWQYAQEVPTETWRSAMTIPRELTLQKHGDTYRLYTVPVHELTEQLIPVKKRETIVVAADQMIVTSKLVSLDQSMISFSIADAKEQRYTFSLTSQVDTLYFGYDGVKKEFFVDRSHMARSDFHPDFAAHTTKAPRSSHSNTITFDILLDRTSIELFCDQGATVITDIFFPKFPLTQFNVLQSSQEYTLQDVIINQLKL